MPCLGSFALRTSYEWPTYLPSSHSQGTQRLAGARSGQCSLRSCWVCEGWPRVVVNWVTQNDILHNQLSLSLLLQMFLESAPQVPLLVARKRKKAPTNSFIICQDIQELKKDGESCLAKVSTRAVGEGHTTCWGSAAYATARTASVLQQLLGCQSPAYPHISYHAGTYSALQAALQ